MFECLFVLLDNIKQGQLRLRRHAMAIDINKHSKVWLFVLLAHIHPEKKGACGHYKTKSQ